MAQFTRYAVYFLPPDGPLARFGAAWLGWDVATGAAVPQPARPGLDVARITATPRKYGFHTTIKPPFRLAPGTGEDTLTAALADFCAAEARVRAGGLRLARIGGFLALVPNSDTGTLDALAARTVVALDPFREAAGEAELARRRAGGLTARQDSLLTRWGYPFVMEEFRFHMTLTGRLDDPSEVERALQDRLAPILPGRLDIGALALCAERPDGYFEERHRYALTGASAASA